MGGQGSVLLLSRTHQRGWDCAESRRYPPCVSMRLHFWASPRSHAASCPCSPSGVWGIPRLYPGLGSCSPAAACGVLSAAPRLPRPSPSSCALIVPLISAKDDARASPAGSSPLPAPPGLPLRVLRSKRPLPSPEGHESEPPAVIRAPDCQSEPPAPREMLPTARPPSVWFFGI